MQEKSHTSVMLFEGWAMQHAPGAWAQHPFHPRNHIDSTVLKQEPESKWEAIRRNLGYTRRYAERVNLTAMTPRPELASTGWCLANAAARSSWLLPSPATRWRI